MRKIFNKSILLIFFLISISFSGTDFEWAPTSDHYDDNGIYVTHTFLYDGDGSIRFKGSDGNKYIYFYNASNGIDDFSKAILSQLLSAQNNGRKISVYWKDYSSIYREFKYIVLK